MKNILFFVLTTFLLSFQAQADLLERMRLEDTFKNRIEDAFHLYDPKARALIRFDYKTFSGTLPGTSIETRGEVNPYNIDSSDIIRVSIEIFTDLEDITPEAKDYVLKVLPIDKNKVSVEYKKLKAQFPKDLPRAGLDSQALSTIARDSVDSLSKVFGVTFVSALLLILGFMFHQNSKKLKEFKQQVQLLTSALADRASAPAPLPQTQNTMNAHASRGPSEHSNAHEGIKKLNLSCLKELFADCYWCKEDAYAAWMWKNIESTQKTQLLSEFPLMKDYSLYFVDLKGQELSYHEHPYYLEPLGLLWTSQEDLSEMLRKDKSLWHFISPMRQQNLPLSLEERLSAVQTKPESKKPTFEKQKQSPIRILEAKLSWGNLSSEDEEALYAQPDMVPANLRENISSLVWLAQKNDDIIQQVLARYDARTLASAWVGPKSVLQKLEAQIPEKKLKLLHTYMEKYPPSRHSEAYHILVAEGFKNEAA